MQQAMTRGKQAGFSLVELMVGMVLGLMLIAGAVSIYLASKQSYVEVEQVAAMSENARFAEQMLGDSLRHVGYLGEMTAIGIDLDPALTPVVGDCTGLAAAHDLSQFVFAASADASGDALGCIDDAIPFTDVLVLKHVLPRPLSDGPRTGADPNDPTFFDNKISVPTELQADRTYMMTNNIKGVLFDGADTPPTINTGGEIPRGTAWQYEYEVFYVRDAAVPQLSRKFLSWNGAAMELQTEDVAEGVENLQIMLGFDGFPVANPDGEVDSYKNPAAIAATEWPNVESVEVYMLVRSATGDVQYVDTKVYQVGDVTVAAQNDEFRRLVSFTSVSLRNLKLILRGGA